MGCRCTTIDRDSATIFLSGEGDLRLSVLSLSLSLSYSLTLYVFGPPLLFSVLTPFIERGERESRAENGLCRWALGKEEEGKEGV